MIQLFHRKLSCAYKNYVQFLFEAQNRIDIVMLHMGICPKKSEKSYVLSAFSWWFGFRAQLMVWLQSSIEVGVLVIQIAKRGNFNRGAMSCHEIAHNMWEKSNRHSLIAERCLWRHILLITQSGYMNSKEEECTQKMETDLYQQQLMKILIIWKIWFCHIED